MFWIDIEDSAGTRYGDGPIFNARTWQSAPQLSRAGTFSFTMPANDPRADLVQHSRIARCYLITDTGQLEVGAGLINKINQTTDDNGISTLTVSGDDLLRELNRRQVGNLVIDDGAGGITDTGPALIMALAPAGWSISGTSDKSILHQFEGESVLNALVRLAEITGESFRLGTGREIVWLTSNDVSGKRLFYGVSQTVDGTNGLILRLENESDSYEALTRIYPYGTGSSTVNTTLSGATWMAPSGYEIHTEDNYIRTTAETSETRAERYAPFKDIADADTLAQAAFSYLSSRVSVAQFYSLDCLLNGLVYPGQTVHVVARGITDGYKFIDIDANLIVREVGYQIDENGLRTTSLQVGTVSRPPESDTTVIMASGLVARDSFTYNQPAVGGNADLLDGYTASDFLGPQYLVMSADTNLTHERIITAGNGIALSDGGAGGALTVAASLGTGLTFSGGAIVLNYSGTPTTIQPDATGAGGSSAYAARIDHTHAIVGAAPTANLAVATTNGEGSSTSFSRADHSHAITASSNPGAAASLLKTDASGNLAIQKITATQGYINSNSTTALVVEQDGVYDNVLVVNTTNGRVGFGTHNPSGIGHFYQSGATSVYITSLTDDASLFIMAGMDGAVETATIYLYQGTLPKWGIQNTTGNVFSIYDYANSAPRIYINSTSTYLYSGSVYQQANAGTANFYVKSVDDNASLFIQGGTDGGVEQQSIWFYQGNTAKWAIQNTTSDNFTLYDSANTVYAETFYANGNYALTPAGDIALTPGGGDTNITGNVSMMSGTIQADGWVSGTTRWGVQFDGTADFRILTADSLIVETFISDINLALAGSQIITKSLAILSRDFTIAASGTIYVFDLPGLPDTQVFEEDDWVRLRYIDRATGLTVADAWGIVTNYSDEADGEQSWTWTKESGTDGWVIHEGMIALDYGVSDDGYIHSTVLDPAGSPYTEIATWVTDPSDSDNFTVHVRMGHLGGITSVTEYGLWAGDGAGVNDQYLLLSDQTAEIHNLPLYITDSGVVTIALDPSVPSLAIGAAAPTEYDAAQAGLWVGSDSGTYKFSLGSGAGKNALLYDGTNIIIRSSADTYITADGDDLLFHANSVETIKLTGSTGVARFGPVTDENLYFSGTALQMRNGTTVYADLTGSTLTLGLSTADHVVVSSTGISLMDNTVVRGQWQTDGDIFIGSDISAAATTYLSIFATAQTYNSESMAAGDMLIGDNSASKANILWDKSAGQLLFRGGTTKQLWIDTDGSLTAGGGDVVINSTGIGLLVDTAEASPSSVSFMNSTNTTLIGRAYGWNSVGHGVSLYSSSDISGDSYAQVAARADSSSEGNASISAHSGVAYYSGLYLVSTPTADTIRAITGSFSILAGRSGASADLLVEGGLVVGSTSLNTEVGIIQLVETDTPALPSDSSSSKIYMRNDKLIIKINDGGTTRYKYLDLTGTGVTWVHTVTAP